MYKMVVLIVLFSFSNTFARKSSCGFHYKSKYSKKNINCSISYNGKNQRFFTNCKSCEDGVKKGYKGYTSVEGPLKSVYGKVCKSRKFKKNPRNKKKYIKFNLLSNSSKKSSLYIRSRHCK